MNFRFSLFVLLLFFVACKEQSRYSNIDYERLSKPTSIIDLPDELEEVSGLEVLKGNRIISINDEKGIIFIINSKTGEIDNKIDFGEKGDFEGLAFDGNFFYTITSKGKLYKIDPEQPKKFEIYQWDIEGLEIESLAYHKGKLYTMTKERENSSEMLVFSLEPSKLATSTPKPSIHIQLESIKKFLAKDEDESFLKEFAEFISGNNIYNFVRPSGITFLPNNHLLILSHHNRFLMEIGTEGEVVNILSLSYEDFHQPEGISLNDEGYLFISNESRGHQPNILKFSYN